MTVRVTPAKLSTARALPSRIGANSLRNYPFCSTTLRTVKQISSIGASISGRFRILLHEQNIAHLFSGCDPVGLLGSLELSFLDNNVLLSRDGVAYLKLGDTKIKWNWRLPVCVSLMLNCPPRCCWIGTINSSHDIKYPSFFEDCLDYFSSCVYIALTYVYLGNKPASRYVIGLLIPTWTSCSTSICEPSSLFIIKLLPFLS